MNIHKKTAMVYCEANFSKIDGKTANGLVRQSEKYEILSVIDSMQSGRDAGLVLDGIENGIPIYSTMKEALKLGRCTPDYFIFGLAPSSGILSQIEREIILSAISCGMDIISGLHEFLTEDSAFVEASILHNVKLTDIRKPPEKKDLRVYTGKIKHVTCPCIAILGTDCAIGKRTTANILTNAFKKRGLKAVMIGTGQTGLMQGAKYGVAMDAIPSQFCIGELEATIVEAFEIEDPDIIFIEGQGALSHPAFSTSAFILRGSCPDGVILQHAPNRQYRCDFDHLSMPDVASEIDLIQKFAETKVIGLTINHENMNDHQISESIKAYKAALKIPVTDALKRSDDKLIDMVVLAFPNLEEKMHYANSQT